MADHTAAHQNYLRSGGASAISSLGTPAATAWVKNLEVIESGQNLMEWAKEGAASEVDLFVARAALQYLCLEDLASATTLLKWCKVNQPSLASEPLIHFVEFITELVQRSREALPVFDLLKHKYGLSLSRDPSFDSYLDRIGEIYFGRTAPKGFMESMLSGLTGITATPTPTPAPTTLTTTTPPVPARVEPTPDAAPATPMVTDVD